MKAPLLPPPEPDTVLPCVPTEWTSTQQVFTRWLGTDRDGMLPTHVRGSLRADVYFCLDSLFVAGRVEKHRVGERSVQWKRP